MVGGVLSYIRSDVPNRRLTDIDTNDLEIIINEISLQKVKWIVIAVYRPPNCDANVFLDKIQSIVDDCLIRSSNIVITGDLNLNLLDKDTGSSPGMKLNNFMDIFDFKNVVREPTCYATNNPTLIDVIITNCSQKFAKTLTCNTSLSDYHYMVVSVLKKHAPCIKNREVTYRTYKTLNADALRHDIDQIPFSVCNIFDDVDDSYWAFNKLLREIVDEHVPIKRRRTRKHEAPFLNTEYRKMLRKKATCWHAYLKAKSNANWERYRCARNRCTSLKRSAIKEYFDDRCQGDTNGKMFWQTIRPFLSNKGCSSQNTIVLRELNDIKTNPSEVCEIFNAHFINVASDIGRSQNCNDYANHPSIEAITKMATNTSRASLLNLWDARRFTENYAT